jgi:diguanylate cyclase (GGDEF)-like protein/PAS domain S-box-containing protein
MERVANNNLFMNAFNFSAIGMAIVSMDGRFSKVNSSLCKILGYTASELEQTTFQAITHPDDLELDISNLMKLANDELQFYEITKRYIAKSGVIVWVLLTVSMVKDEKDNPLYFISQIRDITEQKELREKLEESNERYRSLIRFSPEPMAVYQNGKITFINEEGVKLIGANSYEDIIGHNLEDYIHPDDQTNISKKLQNMIISNQSAKPQEIKLINVHGQQIDVRISFVPVNDRGNREIQVFFINMTQQRRIENQLKQSEERYRALVESSPNAIVVQQDGKIIYTNPKFSQLVKANSEDMILNQSILKFVHPDYQELVNHRIAMLEKNIPVGSMEEKYILLDGSVIDVEVMANPILYLDKPAFQIIIQDISKRKKIERELKSSEERFRLLAEYSSDLITMHDSLGRYLYASPVCKEILQFEVDEMIGQDSFFFIHPDDQDTVRENYYSLLLTGYSLTSYRIRRKDGEYVWFESACKLLKDTDSPDQKMIVVVSRNINERKLAEQKLKEVNELLQYLSTIDGLTGVSNRRAFDERLGMDWKQATRNSTPLSLIMFDIDSFKAFNDLYGHQGGDGCLKQVAIKAQEALGRSQDLLCRYGGEEFAVILPETTETAAIKVAEKIRSTIEALKIPHSGSNVSPWVTISVGTATIIPNQHTSILNLIAIADKALYQAKQAGRNCVRNQLECNK